MIFFGSKSFEKPKMPQLQIFLNLNVLCFDTTQCKTNHKNSLKRHILDNTLSWKNEKTDVKVDICSVTLH